MPRKMPEPRPTYQIVDTYSGEPIHYKGSSEPIRGYGNDQEEFELYINKRYHAGNPAFPPRAVIMDNVFYKGTWKIVPIKYPTKPIQLDLGLNIENIERHWDELGSDFIDYDIKDECIVLKIVKMTISDIEEGHANRMIDKLKRISTELGIPIVSSSKAVGEVRQFLYDNDFDYCSDDDIIKWTPSIKPTHIEKT
jgi:hypothetical protein